MSAPLLLLAAAISLSQSKAGSDLGSISSPIQKQEVVFPGKPENVQPGSDFLSWRGWSYLKGVPSIEPATYESVGDWSGVKSQIANQHDSQLALPFCYLYSS